MVASFLPVKKSGGSVAAFSSVTAGDSAFSPKWQPSPYCARQLHAPRIFSP
jgi:hypothetical protein